MKIEIDLNDIMGDEYGAETLQESVKSCQKVSEVARSCRNLQAGQKVPESARIHQIMSGSANMLESAGICQNPSYSVRQVPESVRSHQDLPEPGCRR